HPPGRGDGGGVASVARLARLGGEADVGAGGGGEGAGRGEGVGEHVVADRRERRQRQVDVALVGERPRHGKVVRAGRHRGERQLGPGAGKVKVLGDGGQGIDAGAGVHAQRRQEVAARQADGGDAVARRGPHPPGGGDGVGEAGVVRLARLGGEADV